MVTAGIPDSEILDENDLEKLKVEKGQVILVMSCASVSHLVANIKNKYGKDNA